MEQAYEPIITRTTEQLLVTVRLAHKGGVHRSFSFKLRLSEIRDGDVAALIEALHQETAHRVKARWPEVSDTPLF